MHRSVVDFVKMHLSVADGPTLEVGAGVRNEILLDRSLLPQPYVGVDLEPYEEVTVVADGVHLPFPDATFGFVLCLNTLEHAEDPIRIADEISRVTRPHGIVLMTAPSGFGYHCPPDRWRFMQGALLELLTRNGLEGDEYPDPEYEGWFVSARRPRGESNSQPSR